MRSIYLATSWKNQYYPDVLNQLREAGHSVYDFRQDGFSWDSIEPNWTKLWGDHQAYLRALEHPRARTGFERDFLAMNTADTCVILTPSGRSAHMEFGWMVGQGKPSYVLLTEPQEWDLMYKMAKKICLTIGELLEELR